MRIAVIGALAILLAPTCPARADDIQTAFGAVSALLQTDGGGLVPLHASCPEKNADPWQYVDSSIVVFTNAADRAVLVNAGQCSGGNGSAQYLVIIQNGTPNVVTDVGIEDMNFLASNMYADGDSLFLYGSRWLPTDPHCCPSKKATLEYNVKTRQHKLTISDNEQ